MPEILLVNPTPRRGRGGRFVKSKSKKSRKRRYRRNPVAANPNPKRRTRKHRRSSRKAASSAGRVLRFRRNPDGRLLANLMPTVMGGAGAIVTDIAMGFLPLPEQLKTGMLRPIVKGAAAFGIGMLVSQMVSRRVGNQFTAGALTVVAYDAMRTFLQQNVPQLQLGQAEEYPLLEWAGGGGMGATFETDEFGQLVDESTVSGMGAVFDTSEFGELVDESTIY